MQEREPAESLLPLARFTGGFCIFITFERHLYELGELERHGVRVSLQNSDRFSISFQAMSYYRPTGVSISHLLILSHYLLQMMR